VFNLNPIGTPRDNPGEDGGQDAAELYTPVELSKLPYNETEWNMQLGNELKETVPALKDMKLPLDVPAIPNQAQFQMQAMNQFNGVITGSHHANTVTLSEGAMAEIFLATTFVFSCVVMYCLRNMQLAVKQ